MGGDGADAAAVAAAALELSANGGAPPIPLASVPELIRYLLDCLAVEANALGTHRRAASEKAGGEGGKDGEGEGLVGDDDESNEEADDTTAVASSLSASDLRAYVEEELGGADEVVRRRGVGELLALLIACLSSPASPRALLATASAVTLRLLNASPELVGRRLRASLQPLVSLMLSRPADEDATQQMLCRILAHACGVSAAPSLLGQLQPLLPVGEGPLAGCTGLEEQRKVVGAAMGLGHIGAALTRATSP